MTTGVPIKMPVKLRDGTTVYLATITNPEDWVGNQIAEGVLDEADRDAEVLAMFRSMLTAKTREWAAATNALRECRAELRRFRNGDPEAA